MSTKALFGFAFFPPALLVGILLACFSKRLRDLFFMLLVFFAPFIEQLDVNYDSHEWYRGTTRGFEVSLLDILVVSLLASSVLAPRRGESRFYWVPSLGFMLVFFLYACFSVAISDPKLFGLFELLKMSKGLLIVLAVAFYLRSQREMRLLIFALGALVCYEGLLALWQRYHLGLYRVPGTLDDSNSLSVFLCSTAAIFVAAWFSKIPKLLKVLAAATFPLAFVGVILTISRAGIIIISLTTLATALATMSYRLTARRVCVALLVLLCAGGLIGKASKTLGARFHESSLKDEYGNKKDLGRGYYIRVALAIVHKQWVGVGLNNWSYWVSNKYGPELGYWFVSYWGVDTEPSIVIPSGSNVDEAQAAPAHSLGALTLGELGVPGLALFTLVWLRWFQMGATFLWPRTPDPMRRMGVGLFFAFWGIFLQSLFEWVYRHLPIYYTFHILLGALASLYYLRRQEIRARREIREPDEAVRALTRTASPVPLAAQPSIA